MLIPTKMTSSKSSRLLAGIFLWAAAPSPASAFPYPRDALHDLLGFGFIMPRQCVAYCGADQSCCTSGEVCYTSASGEGCVQAGGAYPYLTTTWTETETFTSTLSSTFPLVTSVPTTVTCIVPPDSGEISCGNICCGSWQYCATIINNSGRCSDNPGAAATGGGGGYTTVITSGSSVITTEYSAAYKVTSAATITQTGTLASVTETTTSSSTAVGVTGSSSSGLSPGAIAGIVIGVLAGVVILLLLCACFLVRGLWHGLLDLLGLRKKPDRRSRETVIEEEEYRRTGSVHSRRDRHGGWYPGGGGGRASTAASRRTTTEKKKSSGAGWLGLGAAAGTLLLLLGLRRDNKRKKASKVRSEVSSSYMSDSYTGSSPSKF